MAENKTFSVKNGLDVNRTIVLDGNKNLLNINSASVETLNVNNATFNTLTLPSLDAAANTVRVSQNGAGTLSKAQLNFVNTSTVGVTISNNGGTANLQFAANNALAEAAANTVAVYSEGTLRYANANLNFSNSSTINVSITQDTDSKRANVDITVNTAAILTFSKGEKGQKGEVGNKGDMGDQGPQGYQGVQGEKGQKGEQGLTGAQGTQGAQGAIGTGLVISGTVNAYEDLPFVGINNGDIYLTSSTQQLWVFNGLEGNWNLLGELTGPQGFQGAPGAQGSQGFQGIQGAQGVQGTTGTGAQGATGIRGASSWTPITNNITQSETNSNLFTKTSGGSSWNAEVYSKEGYTRGVYVSANVAQTNAYLIVGLNEDPQANPSFTSIDYGFYFDPTGNVSIFEDGAPIQDEGAYGTNTVVTITYNSLSLQYYKDGALVREIARAVGNPLYLDTAFYTNAAAMFITYGAMGEAAGAQGAQGRQGNQGVQGTQGFQGQQGFQGYQGVQGEQGRQGAQGEQGVQGSQGRQGSIGIQGAQGSQGSQGSQGFQGEQGVQGSIGSQGAQGAQGAQGFQGEQGRQGSVGVQGAQGAQGSQGFQGEQGRQGSQGFQGAQGAQGSTGAGFQGIQGLQGAQGAQGAVGSQGVQGASNVDQILGKQTIWVPAVAMISSTTSGAVLTATETTTNKLMISTMNFDPTTEEYAQFMIQMPKSWNEGTLNVQFIWSHDTTATNFGVVWGVEAVAFNDGDAYDTAFGTAVTVADTGGTANAIYRSAEATGLTVAGSPTAEEYVTFRIKRVVGDGSDNMAVDARLHGVKVHYIIDAARDN